MFVDRRGSREGKKTSLRQTDKAKKHTTSVQAGAGGALLRTCNPTKLHPISHSQPTFDAGCNLVNRQFENDFQRVVTRAMKDGVAGMIIVPNDFDKVGSAITLCKWLPGVLYCAAGIHPSNISSKKVSDKQFVQMVQQLREKLVLPEVVAVLCGVDFTRDVGLRVPQEKFLREELKLAGELDLPVMFVLSNASQLSDEEEDEMSVLISIIKECRESFKSGVVHNFYGSADQLKQLLELDLHISISGIVTAEKHSSIVSLIPSIPQDKFLICTDSPYHTPQNIQDVYIRESRNEPSNLPSVAQVCAKAYGMTSKQLSELVLRNSISLFNLNAEAKPEQLTDDSSPVVGDQPDLVKTSEKKTGKDKKTTKRTKDESDEESAKTKKGHQLETISEDDHEDDEEVSVSKVKKAQPKNREQHSEEEEERPKTKRQQKSKGKHDAEKEEEPVRSKKGRKGKKNEESSEEEVVTKSKKGSRGKQSSDEEVVIKGKKGSRGKQSSDEEVVIKGKKGSRGKQSSDDELVIKGKKGNKGKESSDDAAAPARSKKDQKKRPEKVTQGKNELQREKDAQNEKASKKKEEPNKSQEKKRGGKSESEENLEEDEEEEEEEKKLPNVSTLNIEDSDESREDVVLEYACKMCRTKLFTSDNLQAHQTAKGLKDGVCRMYFLEQMDWMKKSSGTAEGRLVCPKCDQKLGRFDDGGISCSCGMMVRPAYKVAKSRVDAIGDTTQSEEDDQDLQLNESGKKKLKKKKGGPKKTSRGGNFSVFRNKDYSGARKRESESDE